MTQPALPLRPERPAGRGGIPPRTGLPGVLLHAIVGWPRVAIAVCTALIVFAAAFLPTIERDTSADGFIDPASPALLYRQTVEDVFGLRDPIVVAVMSGAEDGIYTAEALTLVQRLTERLSSLPFVDPDRVISLSTENTISGTEDGILVSGFFDDRSEVFGAAFGTEERADEIALAVRDFPLHNGTLVARDGSATVIALELFDRTKAAAAYEAVIDEIGAVDLPEGLELHVAGDGAVSGFLSRYIDRDMMVLNPLAGAVITMVLIAGFRSWRGAILPNLIILGTVLTTFGLMAASGVPFYLITNGLLVNLIGIAVADSIHILNAYRKARAQAPDLAEDIVIRRVMTEMWRPITITTLTTMAGFAALAASSTMPPVRYFGVFGAVGVCVAWLLSIVLLPAMLRIFPGRSPQKKSARRGADQGILADGLTRYGRFVLNRPLTVLTLGAAGIALGLAGASRVQVDDATIDNFKKDTAIHIADQRINAAMDGINHLDILIETEPEGLYEPARLRRIEGLQAFLAELPNVGGSTSVVDYVKQLNRAVNGGDPAAYAIPDDPDLIAQLLFLYSASAGPTALDDKVDRDFSRALLRVRMDASVYRDNKTIIPAIERYLDDDFAEAGLSGTATGRVTVDYYWVRGIERSNLFSIVLSFGVIFAVSALLFRSFTGGVIAIVPVVLSVLFVYAVMGFAGISLGVGTSMFAAIGIGLAIDFSIHTLERLRELVRSAGYEKEALAALFPTTGRALLLNFLAVGGGFGVLMASTTPPLVKFGSLVAVGVAVAFIAAVTLIPAMVAVLRPRFLSRPTGVRKP